MTITKHVIQRFQERITFESPEWICCFIQSDLKDSTSLYRLNNIEKRINNGVIYVLDYTKETNPKVVTLYLAH
ncbi:hypothetical protein BAQ48_00095 [Bacillus luti]|uniref:hypothetical protein n=1 Tax=Bacillus luti TaxID=2026191 RepID=UPI0008FE3335|nr:hypothetical protein [Bacillus luti]OJE52880.1 hypothetical protein BAQ48_00095 [Bacillus luti]